jgi:hypothetical protein
VFGSILAFVDCHRLCTNFVISHDCPHSYTLLDLDTSSYVDESGGTSGLFNELIKQVETGPRHGM